MVKTKFEPLVFPCQDDPDTCITTSLAENANSRIEIFDGEGLMQLCFELSRVDAIDFAFAVLKQNNVKAETVINLMGE
jgi:hypothetical protein